MSQLPSQSNQSRQIIMNKSTISGNEIQGNENIQGNYNNNEIQGNENIQGNNNNVDKSDVKVDVTVNLVKNKSVEKTSGGCQEEDEEYEISYIISGTAKRKDKTTLKAIEKHLRQTLNAASLTIYDIDEGSMKLFFNGTQEDLEKLENSFKSGELTDIFDIPIEDVSFVEDNENKLALTIAGNVSYTDIAKLKSALTGVDQKEILVEKIRSNRRDFKVLSLANADLSEADLSDANFSGANLSGASLFLAKLIGANLSEAKLIGADLRGADLRGADLIGAKLRGAKLRGANLSEANLSGANLSEANLIGANLIEANLSEASLSGASLFLANLSEASLSGANLSEANLSEANLSGANFSGVDFEKSIVTNAKFSSNSLGMTTELEQKLIEKGAIFGDSQEDPLTLSLLRK